MRSPFSLALSRSEEHTSELQSQSNLVCRLLLEKKKHDTGEIRTGPVGCTTPHRGYTTGRRVERRQFNRRRLPRSSRNFRNPPFVLFFFIKRGPQIFPLFPPPAPFQT